MKYSSGHKILCIHFFKRKVWDDRKVSGIGTQNFAISELLFAELVFWRRKNSTNPKKES